MSVIFILIIRGWQGLFGNSKDGWSVVREIPEPPWFAKEKEGLGEVGWVLRGGWERVLPAVSSVAAGL